MKIYTIEIQNCIEVKVEAETPEEARMKLIENQGLWEDKLIDSAIIHNPIKDEDKK